MNLAFELAPHYDEAIFRTDEKRLETLEAIDAGMHG